MEVQTHGAQKHRRQDSDFWLSSGSGDWLRGPHASDHLPIGGLSPELCTLRGGLVLLNAILSRRHL